VRNGVVKKQAKKEKKKINEQEMGVSQFSLQILVCIFLQKT
jgi:hypothetical protein